MRSFGYVMSATLHTITHPRAAYEPALRGLTRTRSIAGGGPILATPTFRRVIVLAAHPDDETAGCGGVMALLADRGAAIDVAIATSGEGTIGADLDATEVAHRREEEARRACALLGARPPRFLSHPDGDLPAPVA